MSYASEKFYLAVKALAGPESQRERLVAAYVYNLIHLEAEELPQEIQADFVQLAEAITRIPAQGDEGTVQATVSAIDDSEVDELANKIVSMYSTIVHEFGQSG